MVYRIVLDRDVKKTLAKLDKTTKRQIVKKIDSLAKNPKPAKCKMLTDTKSDTSFYRIRSGKYRIVYTINEDEVIIMVLHVGHRDNVYRKPLNP